MKKVFQKKFASDPDNLSQVEEFISEIVNEFGLDDELKNSLTLSVSEASSNAMVHGNKLDPNKFIDIKVSVDSNDIEVVIKDEGNGFELESVPDPTEPENLLKDSGRGIYIMKSFLKDLKFNFTETGTEVTLILSYK